MIFYIVCELYADLMEIISRTSTKTGTSCLPVHNALLMQELKSQGYLRCIKSGNWLIEFCWSHRRDLRLPPCTNCITKNGCACKYSTTVSIIPYTVPNNLTSPVTCTGLQDIHLNGTENVTKEVKKKDFKKQCLFISQFTKWCYVSWSRLCNMQSGITGWP
jgi:hypothetical protein